MLQGTKTPGLQVPDLTSGQLHLQGTSERRGQSLLLKRSTIIGSCTVSEVCSCTVLKNTAERYFQHNFPPDNYKCNTVFNMNVIDFWIMIQIYTMVSLHMNIILCMRTGLRGVHGESETRGREGADCPLVLCQNGWISEERIAL